MAGEAITAMTSLAGASVLADDVLPIVDVHELLVANRNKKIAISDLAIALAAVGGLSAAPLASGVLAVSKTGNDSTGTRGRLDLPFASIEAAEAAAQVGDLIQIWPGVYTVTRGLGKNGVTYSGSSAVTIQRAITSVPADTYLFGDGGTAMNFYIDGRMLLQMTGSAASTDSTRRCAVILASAGSVIDVQCRKISQQVNVTSGWASAVMGYKQTDDTGMNVMVRASQMEATGTNGRTVYWYSGEMHLSAFTITASDLTNGIGVHSEFAPVPGTNQDLTVHTDRITASYALFNDSNAAAKTWVDVNLLQAAKGYTAVFNSGGKLYLSAQKLEGNTQSDATLGVLELEGGDTWLDAQKISGTYAQAVNVTGGTNRLTIQEIEDVNNVLTDAFTVSGGLTWLTGLVDCRMFGGNGFSVTGGTLQLVAPNITTTSPATDLVQTGGVLQIAGGNGSATGTYAGGFRTSGTITFSSQQFTGVQAASIQFTSSLYLNNGSLFGVNGNTGGLTCNAFFCQGRDALNGNQINSAKLVLISLPDASLGDGTQSIYYDPSDENRVKYAP